MRINSRWRISIICGCLLIGLGAAVACRSEAKPPVSLKFKAETEASKTPDTKSLQQTIAIVRERLKRAGRKNAVVRATGKDAITVQVAAKDKADVARLTALIARPGTIEFAILANRRDHEELIKKASGVKRDLKVGGRVVASWRNVSTDGKGKPLKIGNQAEVASRKVKGATQFLVVCQRPSQSIAEADLVLVKPEVNGNGKPAIRFELNTRGATILASLTGDHLPSSDGFRRRAAILIDGRIRTAPAITGVVSYTGLISGRFTKQEVNDLIATLTPRKALPVKLKFAGSKTAK